MEIRASLTAVVYLFVLHADYPAIIKKKGSQSGGAKQIMTGGCGSSLASTSLYGASDIPNAFLSDPFPIASLGILVFEDTQDTWIIPS